ncbi:MAG: PilZ domain-containing protein [Sphingomonas sp.]
MATRASQFRTVQAASLDLRAEPRHSVHITRTTAQSSRARKLAADLCDISTYGCRLVSSTRHAPGDRLWLGLNGNPPMAATVVWCADGRIGCRFDEPLPRALMRQLIVASAE